MNRMQTIATIEEQYKVRDLDDAIRTLKRNYHLPFYQKKSSLKVFPDVLEYPAASDHDYLIHFERSQQGLTFPQKFRARFTSLQQFYEDPDYRNSVAEIWQNGTLVLGVRDKNSALGGGSSTQLDTCESATGYTASGDASNIVVSNVNYKEGTGSIQFSVTSSSGTATVEKALDSTFTDATYVRKWHFRWVYLPSAPTSITLRFGVDSSNYLYKTVTTQFAGQPFLTDQWNLLAFDLSAASTTGTITTASVFAYDAVVLTGAATGTYYIDAAYNKTWALLDYWYYSKYACALTGSTEANQEYFFNSSEVYATSTALVGDSEWADLVLYEGLMNSLADKENDSVYVKIKIKRDEAMSALEKAWPDLRPQVSSMAYRFGGDYSLPSNYSTLI